MRALGSLGVVLLASTLVACPPSTDNQRASACDALFDAQANQAERCLKTSLPTNSRAHMRDRFRAQCQELFSLPGSSATVEQLVGCARATLAADCRSATSSTPQACIGGAGTLNDGQPCNVSTQCKSLACGFPANGLQSACGTCQSAQATGQPCGRDTSLCADQNDCVAGTCIHDQTQGVGAECTRSMTCAVGLTCMNRVCTPFGGLGSPCRVRNECQDGMACASGTCVQEIGLGFDCSTSPRACAMGLKCDPVTNTCRKTMVANPGEPCGEPAHTACAIGECSAPSETARGICPAIVADGQPCSVKSTDQTCDYLSTCLNGKCRRHNDTVCR